MAILIGSEVR